MMCDKDDAREFMTVWLNENNRSDLSKRIKTIPDTWVPLHAAWQCRINSRHAVGIDTDRVLNDIKLAISKGVKEQTADKPKVERVSIQDRMKEKLHDIIGDIEALIDSEEQFSLYDWLRKNEIPAAYATKIAEYYRPIHEELVLAVAKKVDGYEGWSKAKLQARADFFGKIVSDVERYGDVSKKVRAPTKPRAVSVEKKLKDVRIQKESSEFKLASINLEKVLGAQELWTFNTKYKVFTVIRALDRAGLDIKGMSIMNIDEKNSVSRRGAKRTVELLDKVNKGSKATLKKVLDGLVDADKLQSRLNEHTILLKVL